MRLYNVTISRKNSKFMSAHHETHCTLYTSKKKIKRRTVSDKKKISITMLYDNFLVISFIQHNFEKLGSPPGTLNSKKFKI